MDKITILHTVGKMDRGGVASVVMNVLRHLDRDRFSFIFLCVEGGQYDYENELTKLGAKIIRTPEPKDAGIIEYIKNVRKIICDNEVDIVHTHNNSVFPLIAAAFAGIRTRITHSHTTGVENVPRLGKRIYIMISKVIINILSTERIACGGEAGKYLFGDRKFEIFYNGIVLNDFYFSVDSRKQVRTTSGIPDSSTVIGHVGRMVPVKNQRFIIKTFEQYLRLVPDAYLILVGDGDQLNENMHLAEECGISQRVKFLGSRDDIGALYSAMDLFLFPSIHEGMPVTLVEAQTNRLRCLVSDTVDHAVKLTDAVEFYPLSRTATDWATKMHSMTLDRIDIKKELVDSPYNMQIGVKTIEKLYIDSLEGRHEN